MKTKFLIPVLAAIFAIGMSFNTLNSSSEDYATKYVRSGNMWHQVEVDCGSGNQLCQAIFSEDPQGTPYQVYNTQSLNDPAKGNGEPNIILGPPPSN